MNPETWYTDAKTFDWKGHSIIYKQAESGKPWLVLIHGFPTCSFDWWKIWEPLGKHFNLLAPDMIGFGRSAKPYNHQYSIMEQADIHEALLQKLDIHTFHILAHDYGDTVTQELMARKLEGAEYDLLSVCLLNGGLFPETHRPLLIQKLLMSPVGFLLSRLLSEQKLSKSFSSIFGAGTQLTPEELHEYWELVSYHKGHLIFHKLIWYMQERADNRERWVGALQNFPNRLGLINGPDDPISGKHMAERFKELVADQYIWSLDGIGHYPQVEDAEGVLKAYSEFVALA